MDITPEMMKKDEYIALQSLIYDGPAEEVAQNFINHGREQLTKATEEMDAE
jgi:hypothetical protein